MARISKVDPCMICDKVPCECNKKEPKARKSPVPKAKRVVNVENPAVTTPAAPVPSEPARVDVLAAMKERASAPPAPATRPSADAGHPGAPVPSGAVSGASTSVEQVSDDFVAAVRNLWSMLHPDEQKRYSALMPVNTRAEAWKAKVRNR